MSDDYQPIPRYPGSPQVTYVPGLVVQSITGATEQEQLDSLIAALVALGYVTDDR